MNRTAVALVVSLVAVSTAAAIGLGDAPDSIHAVLGLPASRTGLTELSGAGVTDFRLYTAAERSRIGWWSQGTLYLYDLEGTAHEQRAGALLSALRSGSLVTFAAPRHPRKRHGTVPVARVEALQISASLGGGPLGRLP